MEEATGEGQRGTSRSSLEAGLLHTRGRAGCRCRSGTKSSKLSKGEPKNANVTLKNISGQAHRVSGNTNSFLHRGITQTMRSLGTSEPVVGALGDTCVLPITLGNTC